VKELHFEALQLTALLEKEVDYYLSTTRLYPSISNHVENEDIISLCTVESYMQK
jgi:hypothetical protein